MSVNHLVFLLAELVCSLLQFIKFSKFLLASKFLFTFIS